MSEQVATSQVEEAAPVAANVHPEQAVEAPVSADQKVPEDQKPVDGDEAVAKSSDEVVKPAEEVANMDKKPTSSEAEEKKVEPVDEKKDEKVAGSEDNGVEKAAPEESAEAAAKEEPVVEATNGNAKSEDKVVGEEQKVDEPVVAEETNGVCKRKNENGAEVVEDEKTPKKAKVVDEGDQAPVEETAA